MRTELFTMAYNEEYLIPYFIKHYRDRIPDIEITVYDNLSTDRTAEIARDLGCKVRKIDTGGEIRDDLLLNFKNTAWKESTADWFIVADVDEWVDIEPFYLRDNTVAYYQSEGYDMIGGVNSEYGTPNPMYDKICVWNRRNIEETNYAVGAHQAFPKKRGVIGTHRPKLYHMRYLGREDTVRRYEELKFRLSALNKEKGWCKQYWMTPEEINEHYSYLEAISKKVK